MTFNMRSAAFLSVLLLVSQGTGCSETNSNDPGKRLMDVEVGMTQNQVVSIIGEPQMREAYGGTEFLIYRTGSHSTPGELMPIAIVNGRVTGIGRNVYDNVVRSKAQSDLIAHKTN